MAGGAPAASFTVKSTFNVVQASMDYVADVNGDGLPDLVITGEDEQPRMPVVILLNQGNGQFLQQSVTVNLPNQETSIFTANGVGGLLTVGPGAPPSLLGIDAYGGPGIRLDSSIGLGTNLSFPTNSYVAEVNSPGSYGGYNFGFVSAPVPCLPQVADGGFETPVVSSVPPGYQYNPSGSPWTFWGYSGLSGNGTGFTDGNPNAPEGSQVAFLQKAGSFSQTVNFAAGTYNLSFLAAQRGNQNDAPQTFEVDIDGTKVGTFTPAGTSYRSYTTDNFSVTAGNHTISFMGRDPDPVHQDDTAFLDGVTLQRVSFATTQVSGVAYVDLNGNGRQDPGEPNLANQQVRVTVYDAQDAGTSQVVTTDAIGRYAVAGTGVTVLSVSGQFPANSQPAPSPAPFPPPLDPALPLSLAATAYGVPAGTVGAQEFDGALGMDFNVSRPVTVTSLGVFDSGQDGLGRTLTAILYDRTTQQILATLTFTPDDPGTLIGGSRYKLVAHGVQLPAGFQGSIVAEGYGPGEPNGNAAVQSPTWTTNPGNDAALSFVGTSRNGPAGAFPTNVDRFVNQYAAGTFQFQPATVGGQGTPAGGGNLIQTLDYADSFTLGAGARVGLAPNDVPTGPQLNLEYHNPLAPPRAWSTLGQISTDAAAVNGPNLAYPGTSNAGSRGGLVQAPGASFFGIPYGVRDQYVVQADLVQTQGGVVVSSGP
jgi:hypothetical protein